MNDKYILDESGEPRPCDDSEIWGRWYASADRRVAFTQIGDVEISTVFLALDHNFGQGGLAVLWETMIFGGAHDGFRKRYTSAVAARWGHAAAVTMVAGSIAIRTVYPDASDIRKDADTTRKLGGSDGA
jgi:hypothetical protein